MQAAMTASTFTTQASKQIRAALQVPSKNSRKQPQCAIADTVLVVDGIAQLDIHGGLNGEPLNCLASLTMLITMLEL